MNQSVVFEEFRVKWKDYVIADNLTTNIKTPTDNFLYWFIGFVEGLHSFTFCRKKTPEFRLVVLRSKFESTLYLIFEELRLGHIVTSYYHGNRKKWSALVISKKEELFLLGVLFNGNLITNSQKRLFEIFKQQIHTLDITYKYTLSNIVTNHRPTQYDTWFLGFVEAKGIFTCSLLFHSMGFKTRFIICSNYIEEPKLFEPLLQMFGTGKIEKWRSRNSYCFVVSGVKKIINIYSYFDKYIDEFRTKKKKSYLLFKKVNQLFLLKKHLDLKERKIIEGFCSDINNI